MRALFVAALILISNSALAAPTVAAERQDARLLMSTQVMSELFRMPEDNIPNW
jgi:hypothetical protein